MSITVLPDQFVVIVEMGGDHAPTPRPLKSGFDEETAYRILGAYSPSETSELYFLLSNDLSQPWLISNRHTRFFEPKDVLDADMLARAIRLKANRFVITTL